MKLTYGETVSAALDGHVAVVTIDAPPHNFVSLEMIASLADAFEDLGASHDCRAIVLATTGKSFCAGAQLGGAAGGSGERPKHTLYDEAVRLFAAPTPIVAAVQGPAVGAGLGLTLVADFRIATPEARFVANFVKLGFHPGFGLTHTLPRLIGERRAELMLLTGRRIKAEEALDWGLADQVVPAGSLLPAAIALAREIAENAPLAVVATRKTLRGDLAERVRAMAVKGDDPTLMLNAPAPAARKALQIAGMAVGDIDLFEINEAFAVVPLKFMREMKIDASQVNVNGGAIAMGHPIGATGAILVGILLDELERRDLTTGLVTLCANGAMAPALIIERI